MTTLQEANMTTLQEAAQKAIELFDAQWQCSRLFSLEEVQDVAEELRSALAQQGEQQCTYCDGTGDVHGIDGEWRGTCPCAAAPAPQAQPVKEMPHGWVVNWPDPNGGTKPVYNASSVKPKFGAELDGKLTIYAVYTHPQPAPQPAQGGQHE